MKRISMLCVMLLWAIAAFATTPPIPPAGITGGVVDGNLQINGSISASTTEPFSLTSIYSGKHISEPLFDKQWNFSLGLTTGSVSIPIFTSTVAYTVSNFSVMQSTNTGDTVTSTWQLGYITPGSDMTYMLGTSSFTTTSSVNIWQSSAPVVTTLPAGSTLVVVFVACTGTTVGTYRFNDYAAIQVSAKEQ